MACGKREVEREGKGGSENRQIWAETTFKVGNAAVGVTSLTTFQHCFPCERQTGLIASTSDLFRLAVCNWLLLRTIVPGLAPQPLVVYSVASHKTTRRTLFPDAIVAALINPTIISSNRDDAAPDVAFVRSTYLAHSPRKESVSLIMKVRLNHRKCRTSLF